jgi:hypothetical protein
VTDRYWASQGHKVSGGCDVTESVQNPRVIDSLDVIGGSVDYDESRSTRGTCSLTLADAAGDLTPATAADLLHPESGHELRPWVTTPDGKTTLGVMRIGSPDVSVSGDGQVQVQVDGSDRSFALRRRKWINPVRFNAPGGPLLHDVIRSVLDDKMPGLIFLPDTAGLVLAPVTFLGVAGSGHDSIDPWQVLSDLAAAHSRQLFFDRLGQVVLAPVAAESDQATHSFTEGDAGTLVTAHRKIDAGSAYNTVVAIGEGSDIDVPTFAVARLSDDQTDIPYVFRSSQLLTDSQAQSAAKALLQVHKASTEEIDVTVLPNPGVKLGQIGMVACARLKLGSPYAVSAVTLDLGLNATKITLRDRRT